MIKKELNDESGSENTKNEGTRSSEVTKATEAVDFSNCNRVHLGNHELSQNSNEHMRNGGELV